MLVREIGTVKWFNSTKGFGFIERENDPDVLIHYSEIKSKGYRSLNKGQRVEFTTVETDGPKGLHAQNVVLLYTVF